MTVSAGARSERAQRTQVTGRRHAPGALLALVNVPTAAILALMVILPLLVLIWFSFAPDVSKLTSLSTETYRKIFSKSFYLKLYGKTFVTAGIAAAITVLAAWPAAWALSRIKGTWRNIVLGLIIVPYLTSYLLLIYSIFVLLKATPASP